jgi:hypothetical protein
VQSLDNVLALTRGVPLSWISLISSLRPADNVFTGIYIRPDGERGPVGQIHKTSKMANAQIHFVLTPDGDIGDLSHLLEGLAKEAGNWGTKQVVAEVSPDADYYAQIRHAGFCVFAKQRVFKIDTVDRFASELKLHWRIWNSEDIPAMRALYQALVPPLIQPVEPLTRLEMLGLVFFDENGELQAFADLAYGPVGVWVLPFIHPQSSIDFKDLLIQLVIDLPDLGNRPVYVVARSYQPWIENVLEVLSDGRSEEQALMVKYLALRQRATESLAFQHLENGATEPGVPIAPIRENAR